MKGIRFDWDPKKSVANKRRHGVSFEEARSVFYDENALEFYDFEHSVREERFLMLGVRAKLRMLLVCYTYRKGEGVIRIISARKATKKESKEYAKGMP